MKKFKLFTLLSVLLLMLSACGPPSTASTSEDTNKNNTTNEDGKTQIHWLQHWVNEQGPDKINEVKKAFEAKHPDIELIIDDLPFAQEHDKILSLDLAGNPPDIITASGAWLTEFADAGIIEPIDDRLATLPEDMKKEIEGPMMLPYKGNIYGMPITNGNIALFYNKKLLDEAGVEVPTTWDEFMEASIKLTDPSKNRYALTGNLAAEPPTVITYEVMPFILQAGGKILENNKAVFNSPEGVKALNYLKDLMVTNKVSTPGELSAGEKEKRANFSSGNVAFMFEGPWGVNIQKNLNPDLEFGVAPLPKGEQTGTIAQGSVLALSSKGKNKDAAWKFIEFMGSAEGQLLWDKATNFFPYNTETMNDPYFREDPYLKVFVEEFETFDRVEVVDHYLPNAVDLRKQFTIEIQNFITGKKTAEEALDDAAAYWNEVLEKNK
ncbi:ABC transporter substrate-binding protein [Metabacillus litoralis]|uniref:ABC transporter substrate-binding protein n=1 Tax=Metabacillus litoralis TaxID=152268 RepID=UPI00203BA7C1|nr:sugar ABC transporter substrate-binding protein [Metabacillus litoralis]MCM3655174.1 sugar ABC transporter substrate-binding protein [Metabacillus litoralis]